MRILLSQEATLRISAVGENASSEMESSGPCGTSRSPDMSTVVDWLTPEAGGRLKERHEMMS